MTFQRKVLKKLTLLLKKGGIAVMPTDTIYGVCGSALKKEAVERIYKLRKRSKSKPFIVLISDPEDLKIFGIKLLKIDKKLLQKIWPAKISVVLPCQSKKYAYLHRGLNSLAFRMPRDKLLRKILKISGPLVAPSANLEGQKPAETIKKAKKYFGRKVDFYVSAGRLVSKPSTMIKIKNGKIIVVREGAVKI